MAIQLKTTKKIQANFKKIAVLCSRESWFVPYAQRLVRILSKSGFSAKLFFRHEKINKKYPIVFILSYFRIIKQQYLKRHKHNLVVHESNLPKGKGWAPLFWQIIEGKNKIPVVLFEAQKAPDGGNIYIKDFIKFKGHELYNEIRQKQAEKTIDFCIRFLNDYNQLRQQKQKGKPTLYKRRTPENSQLNINKTLKQQINLLRVANNKEFPAFFYYRGHKFILKIRREDR